MYLYYIPEKNASGAARTFFNRKNENFAFYHLKMSGVYWKKILCTEKVRLKTAFLNFCGYVSMFESYLCFSFLHSLLKL